MEKNTYQISVLEKELDFTSRPAFVNLCDYVLTVAGYDANKNGFGVTSINKDSHTWVLSRMATEWYRIPECFEQISIQTWISDVGKLMSIRNFVVFDAKGEIIGAATTSWVVIDMKLRVALPLREVINYEDFLIPEPSLIAPVGRLQAVEGGDTLEHKVAYSDMDFNRHTNTKRYIEWMCDLLPLEWMEDSFIKRFEIHFVREAVYGDTLRVHSLKGEGKSSSFEIKNQDLACIVRAKVIM